MAFKKNWDEAPGVRRSSNRERGRSREDQDRFSVERDWRNESTGSYGGSYQQSNERANPQRSSPSSSAQEGSFYGAGNRPGSTGGDLNPNASAHRTGYDQQRDWDRGEDDNPFWEKNWAHRAMDWMEEKVTGRHVGRGPKGYRRSDERIHEEVCERLTRHPEIDASDIEVLVSEAEVTLKGQVADRRSKRLAEDVIEDVAGLKDIHNQLRTRALGQNAQGAGAQSFSEPNKLAHS